MLVLSRKIDEALILGDGEIRIVVLSVQGEQVKLGIEAPRNISVMREELFRTQEENRAASHPVSPEDLDALSPGSSSEASAPLKPKSP